MFPPSGAQPLTFGNYNSYVPVEDLFLRGGPEGRGGERRGGEGREERGGRGGDRRG